MISRALKTFEATAGRVNSTIRSVRRLDVPVNNADSDVPPPLIDAARPHFVRIFAVVDTWTYNDPLLRNEHQMGTYSDKTSAAVATQRATGSLASSAGTESEAELLLGRTPTRRICEESQG